MWRSIYCEVEVLKGKFTQKWKLHISQCSGCWVERWRSEVHAVLKLFCIYKRLNNCAAPAQGQWWRFSGRGGSLLYVGHATAATTKTSSLSDAGAAQLFSRLYMQNGVSHASRTFNIRLGDPNTMRYEVFIFGWTCPIKRKFMKVG